MSEARRISVWRDGVKKSTNTIVLTFRTAILPKTLKIGYLNVGVDIYIPNPLQCYSCFRFGHHERKCRLGLSSKLCRRCGETANDHDENCTRKPKCINCSGEHISTSKACDFWKKEKEIVTIKYKENVSFPEARKKVEARHVLPISYSSVIKSNKKVQVKDANTQTTEIPAKSQAQESTPNNTKSCVTKQCPTGKRQMIKILALPPKSKGNKIINKQKLLSRTVFPKGSTIRFNNTIASHVSLKTWKQTVTLSRKSQSKAKLQGYQLRNE